LTITGRVILFVFDELMVPFGFETDGPDVVGTERLLTLTEPGEVLGPVYMLRLVDGEAGRFGAGAAGLEVLPLPEGL
jgi:hypothetical protein